MCNDDMIESSLRKIIKKVLIENGKFSSDIDFDINNDSSLLNTYDMDSVSIISLIIALEEGFTIQFEEEDLNFNNYSSINTIKTLIKNKI